MVRAIPIILKFALLLSSVAASWIPEKKPSEPPSPSCDCRGWKDDQGHGWHDPGWDRQKGLDDGKHHGGDRGGHKGCDKGGDKGGGGGLDPGGKTNQTIPDPEGPDPYSEPLNPILDAIVNATEAAGPWPEEVNLNGDQSDVDVSVSDEVPYDYCIEEGYGNSTDDQWQGQNATADAISIYQDFCLDYYGDPDLRNRTTVVFSGSIGNNTTQRRSLGKRTFADEGATGTPNRWKRGSVITVCVQRNNDFLIPYAFSLVPIRASALVASATRRAINLWNAGLNDRFVSFEFVQDCNDAVFRTLVFDRIKSNDAPEVLATAPFPPRGSTSGRNRDIYVWNRSFQNNFQNVLTAIMAHELGHTIGVAHEDCIAEEQACELITEDVPKSIMMSTIPSNTIQEFRGPTKGDIDGVNEFYSLAAGPRSPNNIVLWPATRGPFINYPPVPRCKWILGICYY